MKAIELEVFEFTQKLLKDVPLILLSDWKELANPNSGGITFTNEILYGPYYRLYRYKYFSKKSVDLLSLETKYFQQNHLCSFSYFEPTIEQKDNQTYIRKISFELYNDCFCFSQIGQFRIDPHDYANFI